MDAINRIRQEADKCVLALLKGEERYVFLYDDTPAARGETLRVLGRFASDPELSFSWYDAAQLSQRIRNQNDRSSQTP